MSYYNSFDRESSGISPLQTGFTTIPSQDQLEQLKAKIRMGVSKVELGFSGTGKSFGEKVSPEAYGIDERNDIRELAKLNKIELTTHAAITGPLSGLTQQGFQESARREVVDEIKRAIDFAADVVEGGPVVAHLGEFQRPIYAPEDDKFEAYENENKEAIISLVNKEDGSLVNLRKNMEFDLPLYVRDENNKFKIVDGLPKISEGGENNDKIKKYSWDELKELLPSENGKPVSDEDVAKFIYKNNIEEQISSIHYRLNIEQHNLDQNKKLLESKNPNIDEDSLKYEIERSIRAIASDRGQINKMERMKNQFESIEKYGVDKTARTIADLGMYALNKQKQIEKKRNVKLERPLYVAPENIFPEQFGGHPQELKKIVLEGRQKMENNLIKKEGLSRDMAKKLAQDHIKATFDIGHANIWKKYFKGNDEEFKKWFMDQIDDLKKNKIIGHVHISDNFGYHDEHIIPGQGNVPIKDALEKFKEDKDIDFIIEAGREGDQAWLKGLREVSNYPLSGISAPLPSDPWGITHNSYFGKTAPPYFIVGSYAQSFGERMSKDFTSWSETSFE